MPIEAGPGVAAGFGARGAPAGGDLGPGSSSLAHAKSQLSPCRRYGNRRGPPRTGVWERSWTPVFLLGAQHRCASARSRLSNAAQADVTKALEKFRAAVGRVQIRRYAFEGLCCERWGSANRRGGREDRAAAVVRVVGRSAIVHPHTPEGSVSHGLAELREDDLHGMVALFEKWNDMLTRYFRESLKKGQS